MDKKQAALVAVYLAAIIAANLILAWAIETWGFGAAAWTSVATSLALIGLDLTARDGLHDLWDPRPGGWVPRMGVLVLTGSFLSWALSPTAGKVAAASAIAFLLANAADAIVYHAARRWSWFRRVAASNAVGATVDSFVFPTLAFGVIVPWLVLAQLGAKVVGGQVWALAIERFRGPARGQGSPDPARAV